MPLVICTYLALMPGPYPDAIQLPDVVLHVLVFTYLMAALVLAHFDIARNPLTRTFRILWVPATWMFFYAVALEVAQAFTPDRRAEILDLLWDTIGIGVGQVCYWVYVRIRPVQINRNRLNDG